MKTSRLNKIFALALGLVAMAIAMGLLSGCGEQPVGPSNVGDDATVVQGDGKSNDGGIEQAHVVDGITRGILRAIERSASKVIGVLGGTVSVALPYGGTQFFVPPGALNRPVRLEMDVAQVRFEHRVYTFYDFGPDGLEFNKTAILKLNLPYPEGTVVSLHWLNPATDEWELQESKAIHAGKVQFCIHHFSKYGIS